MFKLGCTYVSMRITVATGLILSLVDPQFEKYKLLQLWSMCKLFRNHVWYQAFLIFVLATLSIR